MAEGGLADGRATWVGKTENFGDFIKTFADSVVASSADDFEVVMLGHSDNLSVATADRQS